MSLREQSAAAGWISRARYFGSGRCLVAGRGRTGEALHFQTVSQWPFIPRWSPLKRVCRCRRHHCKIHLLRSKDGALWFAIVRWRRYIKFVVITSFIQMKISTSISVTRKHSSNVKVRLLVQALMMGKIMSRCQFVVKAWLLGSEE